MRQNTRITRAALAVTSACAIATGAAVPASAQDTQSTGTESLGSMTPMSTDLPSYLVPGPTTLVTPTGSPTGLCQGVVAAKIEGSGYPDSSSMHWGIAMPGVGPCDLTVTLHWHNLDTGDTGEKEHVVTNPELWAGVVHPYDSIVPTGPGRVEYRLSTDAGAQTGPIVVETEAYDG